MVMGCEGWQRVLGRRQLELVLSDCTEDRGLALKAFREDLHLHCVKCTCGEDDTRREKPPRDCP